MPRGGKTRTSGQGRPKGALNKATKDIREAWMEAIAVAQGTAGCSLADWATRDPESNQKFWLATMQMVPKKSELSGSLTLESLLAQSHQP